MLGRRRVFAVEPRGGRDGATEDLARGCVVPGVTSTYRRIQDAADWCSSDSWNGDGQLRGAGRQVPLLKLASRDSGVEMAIGDSSLATLPGISQDSLDFEPSGRSEPPPQLGRLLASRKLEQVLERSHRLPTSPASLSRQHRPLQLPSKPECEMFPFAAGEQEATEAETGLEAGLEEAKVGGLEPEVWTSLPGQGLRYLEHLCLVLEQMARLQQLYLQLQTQRPLRGQKQLHSQKWGCPVATLPTCQRPQQSQLTPVHPPRDTRSRSCSTGSPGEAFNTLSALPLPMAQPPGLSQGTSLKGLSVAPTGRPLCHS
ncbi:uncharacterized protein C8orf58 homolog isoform X4 [Loxodonta africana]|uniref:uncharacterized protein C8orf58 homolog isoform X4 n=1 Tax=Loxodonta africana TaxID=9785 RepID=UPI000540571F|nr:uncharacterized protein C8orf58 homolog isoform X4 [Loxodonta africana]